MDEHVPLGSHRDQASSCFNQTWAYLDLPDRTPEQTQSMIHVAHTSYWHWTQVDDHTALNISIGLWMLSRVYAVAHLPDRAIQYAKECITWSQENSLTAFYVGYAYEALARATAVGGDDASDIITVARDLSQSIEDDEEKKMLTADLDTVG